MLGSRQRECLPHKVSRTRFRSIAAPCALLRSASHQGASVWLREAGPGLAAWGGWGMAAITKYRRPGRVGQEA